MAAGDVKKKGGKKMKKMQENFLELTELSFQTGSRMFLQRTWNFKVKTQVTHEVLRTFFIQAPSSGSRGVQQSNAERCERERRESRTPTPHHGATVKGPPGAGEGGWAPRPRPTRAARRLCPRRLQYPRHVNVSGGKLRQRVWDEIRKRNKWRGKKQLVNSRKPTS